MCMILLFGYLSSIDKLAFNFQPGRDGHYGLLFITALFLALHLLLSIHKFTHE